MQKGPEAAIDRERWATAATRRGPVLLAIHGGEESTAAIEAARDVAERLGVSLRVVTVGETIRMFGAPDLLPATTLAPVSVEPQLDLVRRRVGGIVPSALDWSVESRFGSPAREIARAARDSTASFVVVDAAPRRGLRRVVAGVRALQIVGRVPCPVLSVNQWPGRPGVVVAATDFSPAGIGATREAIGLAAADARVILVHVPWAIPLEHAVRDQSGALLGGDPPAHFARLLAHLEPHIPPSMTVETRTVDGSVVSSILAVAEEVHADLIAVGTHGPGPVERFFVGSTAAGLVHAGLCPVLVAPPPPASEFVRLELAMTGDAMADDPGSWSGILAAASRRNAGRTVDLEVDSPEIGAQVQASGYILRGLDYDPVDGRVDIMVDNDAQGGGRLTRSIAGVRALGITARADGQDQAIEIRHDRGHTLITFRD